MKEFKIKNSYYSFANKGMLVKGNVDNGFLEIDAYDFCIINKENMSKDQIIDCMMHGHLFYWNFKLNDLEPVVKNKITLLEKLILEHQLSMGYRYITRDNTNDRVSFFKEEPVKSFKSWISCNSFEGNYPVFDNYLTELFSFIKLEDESPTLIQSILENSEVA